MGDAKIVARYGAVEIARESISWCVGDGMHNAIEAIPACGKARKQRGNFIIAGDIAWKHQLGIKLRGEADHALFDILVSGR